MFFVIILETALVDLKRGSLRADLVRHPTKAPVRGTSVVSVRALRV